ncbi:MAG: hypothetical protein U0531_12980 [Dehalococcoidia bacterium]
MPLASTPPADFEHAGLALDLLTTSDPVTAAALAARLNELNSRRQQLTEDGVALARSLAEAECGDSPLIMVGHERYRRASSAWSQAGWWRSAIAR